MYPVVAMPLRIAAVVVVGALGAGLGASAAAASREDRFDPKSALALAAGLASRKLGCTDFSSETISLPTQTSVTLPTQIQDLVDSVKRASIGTCTTRSAEALLVVLRNGAARRKFEASLSASACALIPFLGLPSPPGTSNTTDSSPVVSKIPFVEIGSRAIVLTTGAVADSPTLDVPRATRVDTEIARATSGKVKTFELRCG
jgi:hypothetical protein